MRYCLKKSFSYTNERGMTMPKLDGKKMAGYLKDHWNKPKDGEFVSIKEFLCMAFGGMGIYGVANVIGPLSFAATANVTGMIYGISFKDIYVITTIGTILNFIMIPINANITDNLGVLSKKMMKAINIVSLALTVLCIRLWFVPSSGTDFILKQLPKHIVIKVMTTIITMYCTLLVLRRFGKKYGKFKSFAVIYGIPTLAASTVFVFLPYTEMNYSLKLIWVHILSNFIGIFSTQYNNAVANLEYLMSPNSQERTKMLSVLPIFTGLTRSIFGILFPIVAQYSGGQLAIATYRWVIPVWGILNMLEGLLIVKVQERVIQPKNHKPKISVKKAAKDIFSNKYLWIQNISGIFGIFVGTQAGILGWLMLYGTRMEWLMGIILGVAKITSTPGNLVAPLITKRMSKKNALLMLRGLQAGLIATFLMITFIPSDVAKIAYLTFVTLILTVIECCINVISGSICPDVWDYQQWKCGERLEASTGLFQYITIPAGVLLGYVTPYLLKLAGLVSDWDILYDPVIRNRIFVVHILIAIVGSVLVAIPYFFYDLTPEKHKQIIKELEERAADESADDNGGEVFQDKTPDTQEAKA